MLAPSSRFFILLRSPVVTLLSDMNSFTLGRLRDPVLVTMAIFFHEFSPFFLPLCVHVSLKNAPSLPPSLLLSFHFLLFHS